MGTKFSSVPIDVVPQESAISPVLLLIYINDVSNNISSRTKFFADDLKV